MFPSRQAARAQQERARGVRCETRRQAGVRPPASVPLASIVQERGRRNHDPSSPSESIVLKGGKSYSYSWTRLEKGDSKIVQTETENSSRLPPLLLCALFLSCPVLSCQRINDAVQQSVLTGERLEIMCLPSGVLFEIVNAKRRAHVLKVLGWGKLEREREPQQNSFTFK